MFQRTIFNNATNHEIDNTIKSLNIKILSGYVEISIKNLKIGAPFISSHLIYISKTSLTSGVFPERLN